MSLLRFLPLPKVRQYNSKKHNTVDKMTFDFFKLEDLGVLDLINDSINWNEIDIPE